MSIVKEDFVCVRVFTLSWSPPLSLLFFWFLSSSCLHQAQVGALVQNQVSLFLYINLIWGMGGVSMSNPGFQASGELGQRFLAST